MRYPKKQKLGNSDGKYIDDSGQLCENIAGTKYIYGPVSTTRVAVNSDGHLWDPERDVKTAKSQPTYLGPDGSVVVPQNEWAKEVTQPPPRDEGENWRMRMLYWKAMCESRRNQAQSLRAEIDHLLQPRVYATSPIKPDSKIKAYRELKKALKECQKQFEMVMDEPCGQEYLVKKEAQAQQKQQRAVQDDESDRALERRVQRMRTELDEIDDEAIGA